MARVDLVEGVTVDITGGTEAAEAAEAALRVLAELGVCDPALPKADVAPGDAMPPADGSARRTRPGARSPKRARSVQRASPGMPDVRETGKGPRQYHPTA
jgi:hypothetical protein